MQKRRESGKRAYMAISAQQCRAARAGLKWSMRELAARTEVGLTAIAQFEQETVKPRRATVAAIQRAFEAAGVEFVNGTKPGVRFGKV